MFNSQTTNFGQAKRGKENEETDEGSKHPNQPQTTAAMSDAIQKQIEEIEAEMASTKNVHKKCYVAKSGLQRCCAYFHVIITSSSKHRPVPKRIKPPTTTWGHSKPSWQSYEVNSSMVREGRVQAPKMQGVVLMLPKAVIPGSDSWVFQVWARVRC